MLDLIGRGERIRTSDLSVPNHRFGKKLSFCHFESCSHHEFTRVCGSFTFPITRCLLCAENSVHKLATRFWGVNPSVEISARSENLSLQSIPPVVW